jgi:hypothetical protein
VVLRDVKKGWGLECQTPLKKGDPVAEYFGEMVSSSEGRRRSQERDARMKRGSSRHEGVGEGQHKDDEEEEKEDFGNFLLTVDEVFGPQGCTTTMRACVDAGRWGSAGRFANHSCDQ